MSATKLHSSARCGNVATMQRKMCFYVPDYTAIKYQLLELYEKTGVMEHSAEPGRVGGCPEDADVTVYGTERQLTIFAGKLCELVTVGLMIEGEDV